MLRTLLGGMLALPLCLAGPNLALAQAGGLPGVFGSSNNAPVYLAQSADPRIAQLEEQIRQLSGLVEELNFQVLQMQDQLQRMQEDNEFRFQELEQGRAGTAGSDQRSEVTPPAPQDGPATAPGGDLAAVPSLPQDGEVLGAPPRDFGSITFDGQGNVRESTQAPQPLPPATAQTPQPSSPAAADDTTVAALPPANDADELYRNSYEFILSGDYGTAEQGFRELIERYPGAEIESDAHFWLGEALLAQEKPREAAEIFLSASRSFPQSRKAPEMLYKLGVSLVALDQRDVACATFAEVANRYPQASDAIQERVRQEQALASC